MATEKTESGNVKISDEAIATIASIAAKSVAGVVDLDGGPMGNFSDMIGVKNSSKGIKVEMGSDSVSVDINLIVGFGSDIADVAAAVQDAVREHIEKMTGLTVDKVNVNINSVKTQGRIMNND
jgi:uncharacterized alkaline shock family protein YloU